MHRVNVKLTNGEEYQQAFRTENEAWAYIVRLDEDDSVSETKYLGPMK